MLIFKGAIRAYWLSIAARLPCPPTPARHLKMPSLRNSACEAPELSGLAAAGVITVYEDLLPDMSSCLRGSCTQRFPAAGVITPDVNFIEDAKNANRGVFFEPMSILRSLWESI